MIPIYVQRWLVGASALLAALWAAYAGVTMGWVLPVLLVAALVFFLTQRLSSVSGETVLLSLLCLGYIVGNRGFAHLNLGGIFIGEWVLAGGLLLLLMHVPQLKQIPLRFDSMTWLVIAFVLIGLARLLPDLRTYGLTAVRDFATVYYALFFLIAQPMARHEPSLRLFRRALGLAFLLLPVGYVVFKAASAALIENLQIAGIPLVYYKGDQLAAFLGVGSLYFTFRYWKTQSVVALGLAGLLLLMMLHASMRAAMVGYAAASVVALLAGHWRLLRIQATVAAMGVVGSIFLIAFTYQRFEDSKLNGVIEHVISLIDIEGHYGYRDADASTSIDNNRYRLVWWRTVLEDAAANRPLTGLGFGTDLAAPFLEEYYGTPEVEGFTVRSPHSIIVTLVGRMGTVGLVLCGGLVYLMVRRTRQAILQERQGEGDALFYWCAAWMVFVTAAFGVVLESPMGAVVFWVLLSVAWERTYLASKEIKSTLRTAQSTETPVTVPQ